MDKKTVERVLVVVFALGALVLVILEIVFSSGDLSQLETALFGSMQFLLSIAFAWLLARASARREFQDAQKAFAIAAYRRIREVDKAVSRLIDRVGSGMTRVDAEGSHELDAVREIARGVRESITSSISDWGDVIGEEIETVEQIERLRHAALATPRTIREEDDRPSGDDSDQESEADETAVRISQLESEISRLAAQLPHSLRIAVQEDQPPDESNVSQYRLALLEELDETGNLDILASWFPHYDRHPQDAMGEIVNLGPGVRPAAPEEKTGQPHDFLITDSQGRIIGNGYHSRQRTRFAVNYKTFAEITRDLVEQFALIPRVTAIIGETDKGGIRFLVRAGPQ